MNDLVQKVSIEVWLSEFFFRLLSNELFTWLCLALVTLKPVEIDRLLQWHLKFDLKLFWNPIVVDKALQNNKEDFRECIYPLSLDADCSFSALATLEIRYLFI